MIVVAAIVPGAHGSRIRTGQNVFHLAHRGPQPREDRPAHNGMTDVQFSQQRDLRNLLDIDVIQSVARVATHIGAHHGVGHRHNPRKLLKETVLHQVPTVLVERRGVRTGVDLADGKATIRRGYGLLLVRIDERARHDPVIAELCHHILESLLLTNNIKPTLGGDLVSTLGYEHGCVWFEITSDLHHLVGCPHLKVESHANKLFEQPYVAIDNVTTIFTQVNGDAVCPPEFGFVGRSNGVGLTKVRCAADTAPVPGLANGRDVINIDAEQCHTQR